MTVDTSGPRASIPNETRSAATRAALVEATLTSLVDVGFARTTGVEVCRRAGLTRGALQHHFPDFAQLLAAALGSAYDRLLTPVDVPDPAGPVERWLQQARTRVAQPEFKAVIEVWLGSQNDPDLGVVLADVIAQGAAFFDPASLIEHPDGELDPHVAAVCRAITEALIGLGLGVASNSGRELGHHDDVVDVLLDLARRTDRRTENTATDENTATEGNPP